MSAGKVFLGILAGVAAGAVLGVLYAPDKGSDTRKKIVGKGEDFVEDLEDKLEDILHTFTKKIKSVKDDAADELAAIAKKRVNAMRDDVKSSMG